MALTVKKREDWKDGFLFIGNRLCLDFLNTFFSLNGQPHECLPNIPSLVRWLVAAGVIPSEHVDSLANQWENRPGTFAFLNLIREFREQFRAVLEGYEHGQAPDPRFISDLNKLLSQHPETSELYFVGSSVARRKRFNLQIPEDIFGPLADSIAGLFSDLDPTRIRQCATCPAHFYDNSKKGNRRWCSMAICGNKQKVAAYAQSKRAIQNAAP